MADDIQKNNPLASLNSLMQINDGSAQDRATMNIAASRGNSVATANTILNDSQSLTPGNFVKKYGTDVSNAIGQLAVSRAKVEDRYSNLPDRSAGELINDSVINVGSGFNRSLGGLAALATSTVSNSAGAAIADSVNKYVEGTQEGQSTYLQRGREYAGITSSLDKQDSSAKYDDDLKKDGKVLAELRSFGRGVADSAYRLYENPSQLESGSVEGIGSIFAGGPVSRSINALANVGRNVLAKGTAVNTASSTALGNAATMPIAIGALEGGGAYSSVVNQVMGMKHEDLLKNSQEYKTLIDGGLSENEAKVTVANRAGRQAAVSQAPIAAIISKVTGAAHFEASPLATGTVRGATRNALSETIEEGIQSATGEVSQNLGIQKYADKTQRALEGVGDATLEGAVFGLGSAGLLQAPTVGLAKVGNIGRAIGKRGDNIKANIENSSEVSQGAVRQAVDGAISTVGNVVAGLTKLAEKAPVEEAQVNTDYIQRVQDALYIQGSDLASLSPDLINSVRETFGDNRPDRMQVITLMAQKAGDTKSSPEDRTSAAMFLLDQAENIRRLTHEDLPAFLENASHDDPNYRTFREYRNILNAISGTKEVAQAVKWASDAQAIPDTDTITPQDVSNTVGMAKYNPKNINEGVARTILAQAENGQVSITPEDKAFISASLSLKDANNTFNEVAGTTDKPIDIVSSQIERTGGNQRYQFSMEQHAQRILESVKAGNQTEAQSRLDALGMFAQTMANKVAALEESRNTGEPAKYQIAVDGRFTSKAKGNKVTYHEGNKSSEAFAKRVFAEANAVKTLYDNMATSFPQMTQNAVNIPSASFITPAQNTTPVTSPVAVTKPEVQAKPVAPKAEVKASKTEPKAKAKQLTLDLPIQSNSQVIKDEIAERAGKSERKVEKVEPVETKTPDIEKVKEVNRTENLINKENNKFNSSYKLNPEKSRLLSMTRPLKEVSEIVNDVDALDTYLGKDPSYKLSNDNLDAFSSLVQKGNSVLSSMKKNLKEQLTKPTGKNKDKPSILQKLANGEDVTRGKQNRVLNILDVTDKGVGYNPLLVEAAVLAGLNQTVSADRKQAPMDVETVAEYLNIPEAEVTQEHLDFFGAGVSMTDFKRALADNITRYWGAQENRNESLTYTKGIAEGVAAEVILGLDSAGLIQINSMNAEGKTFNQVLFTQRSDATRDTYDALGSAYRLFDTIVDKVSDPVYFYGEPPAKVASTQMRNPLSKHTRQQRAALAHEQAQPFRSNTDMHSFMEALGEDAFIQFMGGRTYEKGTLNVNHERSLEGKLRTLQYSYRNVMRDMANMRQYAEDNGIPLAEAERFFEYNISKVGRMQMLGLNNPQSDKLAREIFMPTRAELDMTDPVQNDLMWLTVAQGLGLKTEKLYRQDAVAKAKELANTTYAEPISLMRDWLNATDKAKPEVMKKLQASLPTVMGNDASMHGMHSLLTVAKYENALASGESVTKFETFNYLEADGKTNGPIMSLALFGSNGFTPEFISLLRKGGIFVGEDGQTLNNHIQTRDAVDLYESTTIRTADKQAVFRDSLKDNPEALGRLHDVMRFFSALDVDVTYSGTADEPTLSLKRGVSKNPLTISIYGSGIDGIAAKLTNALLDVIYEKMSDQIAEPSVRVGDRVFTSDGQPFGAAEFSSLFSKLISQSVSLVEDKVVFKPVEGFKGKRDLHNFTVTKEEFNALKSHMRTFFVNQMDSAIKNEILDHVSDSTGAIQQATQIQSIFLTAAFRQRLIDLVVEKQSNPEKYPGYNKGDMPSQAELDNIYDELRVFSPIINTGTQNFFVAGSNKADIMPTVKVKAPNGETITVSMPDAYATALDTSLSTATHLYQPDVAGVKGVPSLVIGTGDANMMQIASTMKGAPTGNLKVFDGINLNAPQIDSGSQKVNEAVYEAMMANPMKAVAKSYNTFLSNDPIKNIFPKGMEEGVATFLVTEMTKTITGKRNPDSLLSQQEIESELGALNTLLGMLSDNIDARNDVIREELTLSIDQMASAEAPYVKEGNTAFDADATPNEISEVLQKKFYEKLKQNQKDADNRKGIEQASDAVMEGIREYSYGDVSGARVTDANGLRKYLLNKADISPEQGSIMHETLRSLADKDYTIVLGSKDQTNTYEENNHPDTFVDTPSVHGKIVFENKHIYVNNVSNETVLHELIHASTYDKVNAFYNKSDALSQADRDAVGRIEGLLNEWLKVRSDLDSPAMTEARNSALNAILEHARIGGKAEALNEFMAWSLANQELIQSMKNIKVMNPILRIIGDTLKAIKSLIWGDKKSPKVADDIFSNLRFNTSILLNTPSISTQNKNDLTTGMLYQSPVFGNNERLTDLRNRFNRKVTEYINDVSTNDLSGSLQKPSKVTLAEAASIKVTDSVLSGGFPMNMQERTTFEAIHTALFTEAKINPSAMGRLSEIYSHVVNELSVESFMADPNSTNPNDRFIAERQYQTVTGVGLVLNDENGRSSLSTAFLALAMTNDGFRDVLAKIEKPKTEKDTSGTFDALLDNLGNNALDRLSVSLSGEGKRTTNVRDALDGLSLKLSEINDDQRTFIEQNAATGLDKLDNLIKDSINNLSDKVLTKTEGLTKSDSKVIRASAALVRGIATIANEKQASIAKMGIISGLNQSNNFETLRNFVNEIVGLHDENSPIFMMISEVRAAVQQVRQQFREDLPNIIRKSFKNSVSKEQWKHMFDGFARTDMALIAEELGFNKVEEYINNPKALAKAITTLKVDIVSGHPVGADVLNKAKQLAQYMNQGTHGNNLLRNAYAVSHLFNEPNAQKANTVSDALVKKVDQYISLIAYESTPKSTKDALVELLKNDRDGLEYTMASMNGTRRDEQTRINTDAAKLNHYKGHAQAENQRGLGLQVVNDLDKAKMLTTGYTRVGDYLGSTLDSRTGSYGYYFSPVSGKATYNQGVLQTVNQTASGVDPRTGYSTDNTAGVISHPDQVKKIIRQLHRAGKTDEHLLPVMDGEGKIVAFERAVNPAMLGMLNRNYDLSLMLGAWKGRQVEETLAGHYNESLIDKLYDRWELDKDKRSNEYENIAKSSDPIYADTWKLVPPALREVIEDKFGKDNFPIRRDMIIDAVGTRSASVGDAWTGASRLSENQQKFISNLATGIFGQDAYKYMVQAEKLVQSVVTDSKLMIVVKSVVVPVANMVANIHQLLNRGVPWRNLFSGMKSSLGEINSYVKNKEKEIKLDADLLAAQGRKDVIAERKITTQLRALQDANKRMAIWPLIEAGEFTAISAGGLSQEDIALSQGRWTNLVEKIATKLPEGLKTPYRNAMITKDTSIFKALARGVQYGDFLSKAVLYDDIVNRKKLPKEEALKSINEAFVNYNRFAGRTRGYGESVGLFWFWHFKLRSIKEAVFLMRNNPARSLFLGLATPTFPVIGSIGSPLTDNFFSVAADGRLTSSVGPGMGLRAPSLNPWFALFK